jgi:hypothetical protein
MKTTDNNYDDYDDTNHFYKPQSQKLAQTKGSQISLRSQTKADKAAASQFSSNDETSVRIRDPVTSKVRTLYLNDSEIEQLSKRHNQDKQKVNNFSQQSNCESFFFC